MWAILIVEWFVFMALAWYLEQVFASGTGNRRHPLFFLDCFRKVEGVGLALSSGGLGGGMSLGRKLCTA